MRSITCESLPSSRMKEQHFPVTNRRQTGLLPFDNRDLHRIGGCGKPVGSSSISCPVPLTESSPFPSSFRCRLDTVMRQPDSDRLLTAFPRAGSHQIRPELADGPGEDGIGSQGLFHLAAGV